ncbi:MAG: hypothetical protein LBM96_12760 [Methanobrevibacter sp.]|jgi:hypothetical protein|nr:hypothetical protein [Candidatus Methanoflexus mossambicus]
MYEEKLIESIIVLILFSIAIGIAFNQFKIDKFKTLMINIIFNLILIIAIFISSSNLVYLMNSVNNNINFFMIVVGMVSIFIGFRFIYEIKFKDKSNNYPFSINNKDKNYNISNITQSQIESKFKSKFKSNFESQVEFKSNSKSKLIIKSKKLFKLIIDNLSLPVLFLIYFLAIYIHILYTSPKMWIPANQMVISFSITSILIVLLSYFIYGKIKNGKIKNYKLINIKNTFVGIFLMLSGIYYLIVYMFIPPLSNVLKENVKAIDIGDTNLILLFLIILAISLVLGYFIKKSKRFKNLL